MPRATTCFLKDEEIDIEEALLTRDQAYREGKIGPEFRCIECQRAVRPHRGSDSGAAHFEHLERNKNCSLSDPFRT